MVATRTIAGNDAMTLQPLDIHTPDPKPTPPAEQQPLARLACVPLTTGTRIRAAPCATPATLVLAAAFDKRQECRIRLDAVGWSHTLDVGFCSLGRRYHVELPAAISEIRVTALDADASFWAISDPQRLPNSVPAVWAHPPGVDRLARFFERLEGDAIAEFGWMGGCVLEAFDVLALANPERWDRARRRWLACFVDDQHLFYQDPRGKPIRDAFNTIEALLPVASIARHVPAHPILETATTFLMTHLGRDATCEGCYTVAYPLMQLAKLRGREDLASAALAELQSRRDKLVHEGDIWLRHHGTHRTYRSWARGVAWYLLGHAKCLQLSGVEGSWAAVADHAAERGAWAIGHQRADGLWDNFFHEPGMPPDTGGSAGIAAALVMLHRMGLVGAQALAAARRCWAALPAHLFIDGWLGCVSPSNKRGEAAQHLPLRASETFGMGLMGLLAGTLSPDPRA